MKKRYSEEQIIGFLRDGEAGIAVKHTCRKHGFSEASYYLWKSKFGGTVAARRELVRLGEARDERQCIPIFRSDVNEMNVEPINPSDELRIRIQFRFGLAPVVIDIATIRAPKKK